MALELKFVIISVIYLLCIQINKTDAMCHLDDMKSYALNSCELLIDALNGDTIPNSHNERLKREILENRNPSNNSHYDENRHVKPTHLRVKHRHFPAGGYIVLDHLYAKILRQVYPSTYGVLPKKLYHHHRHHESDRTHTLSTASDSNAMSNDMPYRRLKRHHDDAQDNKKTINVTYCCMNRCRPYDLCEF